MRISILLVMWGAWACSSQGEELEKLAYHDPKLVVDLGVGLWAWPIPADADGDGDLDLYVSCPDVPSNGIWLFENAEGSTAKNPVPVFRPARKLSSTVHYVMPSYVGQTVRVLSPTFEYPNFLAKGLTDRVKLKVNLPIHVPQGKAKGTRQVGIRHDQWRYVDYDADGKLDLVVGIEDWSDYGWDDAFDEMGRWVNGPLHGFVYLLRNTGTSEHPTYAEPVQVTAGGGPVDVYGCPSPNFADFDGDGDLDLLCGEFRDEFTYFENVGTRSAPEYRQGKRLTQENGSPLTMWVQMIVPVAIDWDQDGDMDLIVGDEDGRVAWVEHTGRYQEDRTPLFRSPRYFQQQADTLKCGALATPVGVDWEGDGDFDLVSGSTAGTITLFINASGQGVDKPRWEAPRLIESDGRPFRIMAGENGGIQGPCEEKWGYTTLSVADWDVDGDLDIVFNSIWGAVGWLCNEGTRSEPRFGAPRWVEVAWEGATAKGSSKKGTGSEPKSPLIGEIAGREAPVSLFQPVKPAWTWWEPEGNQLVTQWRTTPVVVDATKDGLPDLIMLDAEGYLALFERAKRGNELVLLPGRRCLVNEAGEPLRLNEKRGGGSGRRKLCATDWDQDGQFDLLLNSSNADWLRQVDHRDGRWFFKNQGRLAEQDIEGHDVSPTTVDFNADGLPEFIGGAEDGRMYWLKRARK